jgi:radical SAM enzyme (TIGR01210 family)
MRQIDYVFDFILSDEHKSKLSKIILSNNGSILDEETFSSTALFYFVAKMNMDCPNVETLSIETRVEYADIAELEILARVLREGEKSPQLELAIGFEAFDDEIRNKHFMKGLSIKGFEEFAQRAAEHNFKIKAYFMLKPLPNMAEGRRGYS